MADTGWLTESVGEDANPSYEHYAYFMRPEPRRNLSPIRLEYDEIFGRKVRVRDVEIGMVRNAQAKNRKKVKCYLEPYPHIRIKNAKPLQGWYKGLKEPPNKRPRPCFTEAILTEPYGGWCPVGCAFCYSNSGMRGYRGTGLVTVPLNYGEQITNQLKKVRRGAAGYITSFTDPFLPLEEVYHNSQGCAEAFVEVGLPIFFLSRLRYPEWALDLLTKNSHSYAQISVNTSVQNDWQKMAPGALDLEGIYAEIREMKNRGIYVSIQVNPIIPKVTSHGHINALFRNLAEAGADHVIVKFVEAGYSWAPAMVERMAKRFGDRGREFGRLFTQNIGGERTVDEGYRLNAHEMYSRWAKQFGLTYSVCYEYRYERDDGGNILSKTGVSIGREFTTSDQCHGHRVPVYYRDSAEEKFKPLEECPPSGCLYCAEENHGNPRCGDRIAGEGRALRFNELTYPIKKSNG